MDKSLEARTLPQRSLALSYHDRRLVSPRCSSIKSRTMATRERFSAFALSFNRAICRRSIFSVTVSIQSKHYPCGSQSHQFWGRREILAGNRHALETRTSLAKSANRIRLGPGFKFWRRALDTSRICSYVAQCSPHFHPVSPFAAGLERFSSDIPDTCRVMSVWRIWS